jgi:O-succinylbenzoate synthase
MDLVGRAFRIPLKHRFRGLRSREGLVLRGPHGWAEFSPFPDYPARLTARWWDATREALFEPWPPPLRSRIPVNVTVPAVGPEDAFRLVASSACSTAKVKVGVGDDVARVEAVRDALGPSGRIRIDVNGGWDVDAAAQKIGILDRFGLEYVEQPVATLEEMAGLRRLVDVPIAADESVRTAYDPVALDLRDAADVVVLKVAPLGGVRRALEVAEACGVPAVVSSALETSVGMAAEVALAAALPALPYACGLGTVTLLAGDVTNEPLVPVDGAVDVRRPDVDDGALAPYEIADASELWNRLESASARTETR